MKRKIGDQKKRYGDVNRQELRLEPKGKALKEEDDLKKLGVENRGMLYFKVSSL